MVDEQKKRILVVDDAPANLRILAEILMPEYEISVTTNGFEAIEIATDITDHYHHNQPNLILLDIMMPDIDGYQVCRNLRQNSKTKDIPIIFVTANTDDTTLEKAFDSGGTDYVRKPVNRVELLVRIRSALLHQELTQKLLQEEKLEAVLETAGAICHEMNQPMQAIYGFTQLLLNDLSENDEKYEYISIIKNQIEKMGDITKKLMRITKYETRQYIESTRIIDLEKAVK